MAPLKISVLSQEHAQTLQSLWTQTFKAAYADVHSEENIAAYCDANFTHDAALIALTDAQTLCKLAGTERAPLGYYVLRKHRCAHFPDVPACELKQIYLMPDAYGAGIGKALFDDAVSEARARQTNMIWLSVSDKNVRAQRFYQKLGFAAVGRGPDFQVGTDLLTSQVLVLELD